MKKLKVILNGGLKGCCSVYSAAQMRQFTKTWFDDLNDIHFSLTDIEEEHWKSEPLADLAYKYFKDSIFPLTYFNDKLVIIGRFPERDECLEIIEDPKPITEKLITETAEKMQAEQKNK